MRKDSYKVAYCYLVALRLWDEGWIDTAEYAGSRSTYEWEMWTGYNSLNAAELQEMYSWDIKNERPIPSNLVKSELEKRGGNV